MLTSVASERYQYTTDGYVVRNNPRYVENDNNTYRLTQEALDSPKDCLLPLENNIYSQVDSNSSGVCYSINMSASMYRDGPIKRPRIPPPKPKTTDQLASIGTAIYDDISVIDIYSTVGYEILKHFNSKPDPTETAFAKASAISISVVREIINSSNELEPKKKDITYPTHKFDFLTILSAYFGLRLPSYEVNRILEFTHFILRNNNRSGSQNVLAAESI